MMDHGWGRGGWGWQGPTEGLGDKGVRTGGTATRDPGRGKGSGMGDMWEDMMTGGTFGVKKPDTKTSN